MREDVIAITYDSHGYGHMFENIIGLSDVNESWNRDRLIYNNCSIFQNRTKLIGVDRSNDASKFGFCRIGPMSKIFKIIQKPVVGHSRLQ